MRAITGRCAPVLRARRFAAIVRSVGPRAVGPKVPIRANGTNRGWQVGTLLDEDDQAEIASAVDDTCTGILAHDLHLAQDTPPGQLAPEFLTRANMLASGQFAAVLRDQAAWALQSAAAYLRATADGTLLTPRQWASAAVDNRHAAGRHGRPLPG